MLGFIRKKFGKGAALLEYAILIGAICIVAIIAVVEVGEETTNVYETVTVVLDDVTSSDEVADDPTSIRPYYVDNWGCLEDANGAGIWCAGEPTFTDPGEMNFQENNDAMFTPFQGLICAYDLRNSTFFSNNHMGSDIYACVPPEEDPNNPPDGGPQEQKCTMDGRDYERYDGAWGDRDEAQVIADNDMYCEPDPSDRGAYRAVFGATEEIVLM